MRGDTLKCHKRSEEHTSALLPYTTLFRSRRHRESRGDESSLSKSVSLPSAVVVKHQTACEGIRSSATRDRKSTRLHSCPTRRSSDLVDTARAGATNPLCRRAVACPPPS